MTPEIQKRGWKYTRRSDSVVKVKFARELAEWLSAQEKLLSRYQVTQHSRLINRNESLKTIDDEVQLHRKLTQAIQQFVTQEQWVGIRQHFYRYKRQQRDGIKVVAVSEAVYSELNKIKLSDKFGSLSEVIDDLLSYREAQMSDLEE